MKIRRKLPKPPRSSRPAYVIGYRGEPPSLTDLQCWFNLEYGGPLAFKAGAEAVHDPVAPVLAAHGPWTATLRRSLPIAEADVWKDRLGWGHTMIGLVLPATGATGGAADLVLHAARLARGLSLLTEGTAYDPATQAYWNPSDWRDRPLERFVTGDHVSVEQADRLEAERDRYCTKGLTKFGLDELETFRPVGLPSQPTMDRLADLADEIVRSRPQLKVGASLTFPLLGVTVQIVRHGTRPSPEGPIAHREVSW